MSFLNERAFTLIELMIVLAIVGILAVLALEGHKALLAHYQVQGASRMLLSDLRTVQQQALTTRHRHWVNFDSDRRGYSIWVIGTRTDEDPGGKLVRQVKLPASVRFGAAPGVKGPPSDPEENVEPDGITFRDNRLMFMPSGGLGTRTGAIYLTEDSQGHRTHAITVTVSGHVRFYSWTGSNWR